MICLGFILTSCSGVDKSDASFNRDPFENTNRQIYAFNDSVDTLILEPVAYGYNKAKIASKSRLPELGPLYLRKLDQRISTFLGEKSFFK